MSDLRKFDHLIRRRAGRLSTEEKSGEDLDRLRADAAAAAGLSDSLGRRVQGSSEAELFEDAARLAESTSEAADAPSTPDFGSGVRSGRPAPPEPTMDALIKATLNAKRSGIYDEAIAIDRARGRS